VQIDPTIFETQIHLTNSINMISTTPAIDFDSNYVENNVTATDYLISNYSNSVQCRKKFLNEHLAFFVLICFRLVY